MKESLRGNAQRAIPDPEHAWLVASYRRSVDWARIIGCGPLLPIAPVKNATPLVEDQYPAGNSAQKVRPAEHRNDLRPRRSCISPGSCLVIETFSRFCVARSTVIGCDAITIGYGCEIHAFDEETIKSSRDVVCVRLLTRHPAASRHFRREPLRMARHLLVSPTARAWLTRAVALPLQMRSLTARAIFL